MSRTRYLGIVPARGGSKGIPRKNLQLLGGRPLVQWTIEAALASSRLDAILLTSDDAETIELARSLGCPAPFVRPPELADDASPTVEAVLDALDRFEMEQGPVENVVVLQPTSPFRAPSDIDAAVATFESSGAQSLLAVVPVSQHPAECYRLLDGRLVPALAWPDGATGRQGFPEFLYDNGAIYIASTAFARRQHSLRDERSAVHVMEPSHSLDIDEPYDLELARGWLARSEVSDAVRD